jgi:hypothetical protein
LAIVLCPELPLLGLTQDIHNPTRYLCLWDFSNAPMMSSNNNGISKHISISIISDTIRKVHVTAINQIFNYLESAISLPIMLEINKITTNQT